MLVVSRLLLGMGEGGGFPAATRAVAEWFPVTERATAMGIINAGTAVGGVIAPPLLALIITHADWRAVFYVTGARRHRLGRSGGGARTIRPIGTRASAPTSGGCSSR